MDYVRDLTEAGNLTRAIGGMILMAADLEDMSILDQVREQLKTVDNILSIIVVTNRMQMGRDN